VRHTLRQVAVASVVFVGWASSVAAQDATVQEGGQVQAIEEIPLEELLNNELVVAEHGSVMTASRRAEPIEEAPAAITVITSEQIERFGYRTLGEILDATVNIHVANNSELDTATVRGFGQAGHYNERMLLLVDGHTMNEAWAGGADFELIGLDVSAIDRVEIVRGPASALYGTNGILAVVNVITKEAPEDGHVVTILGQGGFGIASAGPNDTSTPIEGRIAATGRGSIGRLRYFIHGFGNAGGLREYYFPEHAADCSDGAYPGLPYVCSAANRGGVTSASRDWRLGEGLHARLTYGDWSAAVGYARLDEGLPYAPWTSILNDTKNGVSLDQFMSEVSFNPRLTRNTQVTARVFVDWTRWIDHLTYLDDYYDPAITQSREWVDEGPGWNVGAEVRLLQTLVKTEQFGDQIHVGVTGIYNTSTSDSGFVPFDPVLEPHAVVPAVILTGAAFAENELSLSNWFQLVTGLRFDLSDRRQTDTDQGNSEFRLSPRVGVVVKPYAQGSIKLLYGEGFRSPNQYDMFYDDGAYNAANPGLKAEVVRTGEILFTHTAPPDANGLEWSVSLGGYYSQLSKLLQQETICVESPDYRDDPNACPATDAAGNQLDDRLIQRNITTVEMMGLEMQGNLRSASGMMGYLNIAIQRARFTEGRSDDMMNSPTLVSSAGFSYPVIPKLLFIGLEGRLLSKRLSWDVDANGDGYIGWNLKPLFLLNANIQLVDVAPGLTLSLTGRNVLFNDYSVPITTEDTTPIEKGPGIPTTILLGAQYEF